MIQVNSKQKRRWLKQILGVTTSKALWIAPALLSPVFMAVPNIARAQTPTPSQTVAPSTPSINDQFVLDWLNYAAINSSDMTVSARAYAEALRGRKFIVDHQRKTLDPAVDTRLKQVAAELTGKGLTRPQVEGAINKLGAFGAAPRPAIVAKAQAAGPALAGLPSHTAAATRVTAPLGPTAQVAPAMQIPASRPGTLAPVISGVFQPSRDATVNQTASGQVTLAPSTQVGGLGGGEELYNRGLQQLGAGNREAALESFRAAWKYEREMDITTRGQLKDKLTAMSANQAADRGPERIQGSQLSPADQAQRTAYASMSAEVSAEINLAEANREKQPRVVAERLATLRQRVSQANLGGRSRKQLLTLVDRQVSAHQTYMKQNEATINQTMHNRQVLDQMELEAETNYLVQQKIASKVDAFNDLMDEGRYAEAEVQAKQVWQLDRNSQTASLLLAKARNQRRIFEYEDIRTRKEDRFIDAMLGVDASAVPISDSEIFTYPEVDTWNRLTEDRNRRAADRNRGMSPEDAAIYERLKQPIMVDFQNRPLNEVAEVLQKMVGIPIFINESSLDAAGLAASSETPITLSLPTQIQLRSALNLMLGNEMVYQVRNEVLEITSSQDSAKANITRPYNVKDLVTPIPNFFHDNNSGLSGAIRSAYETVATGRGLIAMAEHGVAPSVQFASGSVDPNTHALGQIGMAGGNLPPAFAGGLMGRSGSGPQMGSGAPMSMGSPAGIGGGAAMADFGTLINLITQTVEPLGWAEQGGNSTILQYAANLSLVVSAPQTTHEKIAELLESLRRLQDLQVTIEVKFITLNDNFFERMGVDFDFKIDDNVRSLPGDDSGNSATVGLSAGFNPFTGAVPLTGDLDVTFGQESFASAIPIGSPDLASGANLGFAILSDIEMFFFMNAAQGDQRTNVLQAPRVTMFDGQFASINDTVNRPFVTGLIPVVGDFAVAQQPVIVVINEGTILNVQATVTSDKRYVRLTLNPTFNSIDRVDTFTFEGTRTTRTGSNVLDPGGETTGDRDDEESIITGSTVQQPSLVQTSISTTVSVPDGGTILLGGIKRMREGRIERGVPILSKIPYVNRLFKNTAIGRETSTLMMTVTPRIIIQEEEEAKLGISTP